METKNKDHNTTTHFLLRALRLLDVNEVIDNSRIKDFGFVQAFVKDVDHPTDYTHPVFVLFKQDQYSTEFRVFLDEEYEKGLLLDEYDYDENYIVLVYDYPEEYKRDYEKIMQGKYSKVSSKFRSFFKEKTIYKGKSVDTYYTRIFNRDEKTRQAIEKEYEVKLDNDSELRSIPDMEKETLNINKYLNNE